MYAVSTTRQADDWDIDFSAFSAASPLSLTETFHFIRAVKFSRHAHTISQLAMTVKLAARTENGVLKMVKIRYALFAGTCVYVYSV